MRNTEHPLFGDTHRVSAPSPLLSSVPSFRPRLHRFMVEYPVQSVQKVECYSEDGRASLEDLYRSYMRLSEEYGWVMEGLYAQMRELPGGAHTPIPVLSFRTPVQGPALWVLSGIHGEEPAGPNAIGENIETFADLGRQGVPMVVVPLCNAKGYSLNWRFPNTSDRKYRSVDNPGGGISVGESEHFLPSLNDALVVRRVGPASADALGLTSGVLRLSQTHAPLLVFDHHEDEALAQSYIYAQGEHGSQDPIAAAVVRVLLDAGVRLEMDGTTRFGEKVSGGIVPNDSEHGYLSDGSIDELLTSKRVIIDGREQPGPGARLTLVVETPAKDLPLSERMKAHAAVFRSLPRLWEMATSA